MTLTTARVKFIVPKEATNLVTNPSFEIDTTGYTASGAGVSIARSTTYSRRGIASCEITTAANVISGLYYPIALTSGTTYTFSADVLDYGTGTFNLFIATAGDVLKSTNVTWTGTGYWKRRSVTWLADATATFRLYITRSAVNGTAKYYVDGWQLESGIESTYLDGDMIGWIPGETAYRWNGTRHASTSWRSGQTRTGGTYVSLSTYAKLLTIVGLGMTPITNVALPSTMGGSWYQNSVVNERPFSLLVNFNGNGDYATIQKARDALTECVRLDKTIYRQPMLIQYDELDGSSLEMAETLEIPCLYESGLEMTGDGDAWNEKASMNFRMYMPLMRQQGERGTALGFQTSIADADFMAYRDTTGLWANISTNFNALVSSIVSAADGSIYIGGSFTNLGDADGDYIVKWNGTAFSSLGTGMNERVNALVIGPDGSLYAGGLFTLAGGIAATAYIAKWNGSAWTPLGTGMNGEVKALVFDQSGNLYAGGDFTLAGGIANTIRVAKWNGTAWSALSTGADDNSVTALAIDNAGLLYAGGNFSLMSGVANTLRIAKWNGTAWSAMGTGAGDLVRTLAVGADNMLYAGGDFLNLGDANGDRIAAWDGSVWKSLSSLSCTGVYSIFIDTDGLIYIGTKGTSTWGGSGRTISIPGNLVIWNGSTFMSGDIVVPGTPTIYSIHKDKAGKFYLGYDTTGAAISATKTSPNVGSAAVYPKVIFTGPGSLAQLKNYTTFKAIYFNLTLNAGEVATLNLDPSNVSFTSTFRGNILNTILPGSNMNWELLSGSNNISAYFYTGTTAASAIEMTWKDAYHSLDGALNADGARPVAELQSWGGYPHPRPIYNP